MEINRLSYQSVIRPQFSKGHQYLLAQFHTLFRNVITLWIQSTILLFL